MIPQYKKRALEKDAIVDPRRCPLEIAFIIGLCLMACVRALAIMIWNTCSHKFIQIFSASYGENLNDAISLAANAVIWFVYFTVVYWLAGCVREIFVLKKSYLRERSLCVKFFIVAEEWREQHDRGNQKTCSWMLENIQSILPPSI